MFFFVFVFRMSKKFFHNFIISLQLVVFSLTEKQNNPPLNALTQTSPANLSWLSFSWIRIAWTSFERQAVELIPATHFLILPKKSSHLLPPVLRHPTMSAHHFIEVPGIRRLLGGKCLKIFPNQFKRWTDAVKYSHVLCIFWQTMACTFATAPGYGSVYSVLVAERRFPPPRTPWFGSQKGCRSINDGG